jgi:ParB family transcriptional regulator, chromosome partitioning protein
MNPKKQALGRGLSALLNNNDNEILSELKHNSGRAASGTIANIPVDSIVANPYQPRQDFDEMALEELADSIRQQGIIQPVTVRMAENGSYQLISGERRLKASKIVGLEMIPAYVRTSTDHGMLEMALVENIQRKNLNAIEIAITYQRLIDECDLTQEQMSEKVGMNRTTVTNYLRLLKLPAAAQLALRQEKVSMGHARALINVKNINKLLAILDDIINKDLSVRQTEQLVRSVDTDIVQEEKAKAPILPVKYTRFREQLSKLSGLKVDLKKNSRGHGSVTFRYKSDDELEKFISKFRHN